MSITWRSRPMPPGPGPDDALARLLADATPASGFDRELRGEAAATAAFREALSASAFPSRKRAVNGRVLIAATVISIAGLSGGGVAFAAATGHLTSRPGGRPAAPPSVSASLSPRPVASPLAPPGRSRPGKPSGRTGGRPAAHSAGGSAGQPASPASAPPAGTPGGGTGASTGTGSGVGVGASTGPLPVSGQPSVPPVHASVAPVSTPSPPSGVP